MPRIRYTGASTIREVSRDDFVGVGVNDQDSISIDTRANREVEISEAAAELLLRVESNDWQLVPAKAEKVTKKAT